MSVSQTEEETLVSIANGEGVNAVTTAFDDAVGRAVEGILAVDGVAYVRDHRSATGLDLVSEELGFSVMLVGLDAAGLADAKAAATAVRRVLDEQPDLTFDLSGGPA